MISKFANKLLGFRIFKPKVKLGWKPIKATGPDVGSYKPELSIHKLNKLKRATSAVFGKQKRIIPVKLTKDKTIPGAGTYKIDNIFKNI